MKCWIGKHNWHFYKRQIGLSLLLHRGCTKCPRIEILFHYNGTPRWIERLIKAYV